MNLLCSCVLYMYGFDFLPFYPYFYYCISMLHFCNWKKMHSETEFFPRTKILFQSAFFSSYKNVASKSFYKSKIHPFHLNAYAKK